MSRTTISTSVPQANDDESSDWQQRAVEDIVDRLLYHLSEARRGLRGGFRRAVDAGRTLRERLSTFRSR